MGIATNTAPVQARPVATRRIDGVVYDRLIALFSVWLIIGLFVDGWAHTNLGNLETFFTPWHAILYSGFGALGFSLLAGMYLNVTRARLPFRSAIPKGYEWSVIGVPLFAAAGVGDMLWHIAFGIEANIDALLSPTHLVLLVAAGLMITGPIRATWHRFRTGDTTRGWRSQGALIVSLLLVLSLLTFFTQYANLAANNYASGRGNGTNGYMYITAGIMSVIIQTFLMSGILLLMIKRYAMPIGAFTLIFTTNAALMAAMRYRFISIGPGGMVGMSLIVGVIADVLYLRMKPGVGSVAGFRLMAAVIPFLLFAIYMALQVANGGTWWNVHMVVGTPFIAAGVGWLTSHLIIAPTSLEDTQPD